MTISVTEATAQNDILDALTARCAAGSANPNAVLELLASGDVEVATLTLSDPPFLAATGGEAVADTVTADTNATGGTVVAFRVLNRDGDEIYRSTAVGTSGGPGVDLVLSSLTITAAQTVDLTSYKISLSS